MNTTEDKHHDVLGQFRHNVEMLRKQGLGSQIDVPENIRQLFKTFLDQGATREDILNLLGLLCHTDDRDYDSIAHEFL